jgi:hypothetical protein
MIKILRKKNPGIFTKDNSNFEFQKYKEYIEDVLLKKSITVQNIPTELLVKLVNNLDLTKIIIEKHKSLSEYSNSYGIYLKLDFSDDSYGRYKNFTYSILIFESLTLFNKTYIYVPIVDNDFYDSISKETNIYKIIKEIYPLFITNFIKLCKQKLSLSSREVLFIEEELNNKFKVVLRKN